MGQPKLPRVCRKRARLRRGGVCGRPADWHLMFTPPPDALTGLACERHARGSQIVDLHRFDHLCGVPGTVWRMTPTSGCVPLAEITQPDS